MLVCGLMHHLVRRENGASKTGSIDLQFDWKQPSAAVQSLGILPTHSSPLEKCSSYHADYFLFLATSIKT